MRMNTSTGNDVDIPKMVNTKKPAAHPASDVMVLEAVRRLKKRGGVSLTAIKKYITEVHKVDADKIAHHIRKAVRKAVTNGKLVQLKGSGANGAFALPRPPKVSVPVNPNDAKSMVKVEKNESSTAKKGKEFRYPCGFCDSAFSSFYQRNKHTKKVHGHWNNFKDLKCKFCGRMFKNSLYGLYIHFEAHMNENGIEKPSKYSLCNGQFSQKMGMGLQSNIRRSHKDHMKIMNFGSGEKKKPRFECGICGLNFLSMESIRNHGVVSHNRLLPEGTAGCQSDTIGSSRNDEAEQGSSFSSQQTNVRVKEEEIEFPLLQPELVPIVKSEPEEFVFVNYLKDSALGEDGTSMSCTPAALRLLIIDALEFHSQNAIMDPGVSYELIHSYLEETFNVKTDCLNVLNEMVLEGILTQSIDGKYSRRNLSNLEPVDEEEEDFNRLMREVLGKAEDSPVIFWDILKYLENHRSKWFFQLPPRIKRFLEMNVKNGRVVRIFDRNGNRYRYRMANGADLNERQGNDDQLVKNPRLGIQEQLNTFQTDLDGVSQCVENSQESSPQISEPKSLNFQCKYCGQVCRNTRGLTKHLRSHSEVAQGRPFKCSDCKAGFHSKNYLKKHVDKVHLGKEKFNLPSNFECEVCPLHFSSFELLTTHTEDTHKPSVVLEGVLECGMCPETFVNHEDRLRHSLEVHKKYGCKVQYYTCKTCGYKSRGSINNFYAHFNTHTDGRFKPYRCQECGVRFAYSKQLKLHIPSVHYKNRYNRVKSKPDPYFELFIKSEPGTGTVESHSDTVGKQSDFIENQSDTIGSQPDTVGNQSGTIGSLSNIIGYQLDIKVEDVL